MSIIENPDRARRNAELCDRIRGLIGRSATTYATIARRLGISETQLDRQLSPDGIRKLAMHDFLLLNACLDGALIDEFARLCGGRFVPIGRPENGADAHRAVARYARKTGELQAVCMEALADGAVTPFELAQVERSAADERRAEAELVASMAGASL